jgi:predicted nucleic acid-binding protein
LTGPAVTDSACVIALERIGQLELLPAIFEPLLAPPAVLRELGTAVPWLTIRTPASAHLVAVLEAQLGAGEAGAIALALELGNARVILDDRKARSVARRAGLAVIGTLGVLVVAKRQGLLPHVEPVLAALRQARFHMSPALYREALRLAGEAPPA